MNKLKQDQLARKGCLISLSAWSSVFFFFQAEDGIRDDLVTGVQTCALPILAPRVGATARVEPPAADPTVSAEPVPAPPPPPNVLERHGPAEADDVPSRREREIGRASCRERV